MEIKMKELLIHLGEVVTVKGRHYNALCGKYILSGITQTVIKENGVRKWKIVLQLTELNNGKVNYQINPNRYEISVGGSEITKPISQTDRIKKIQDETREKIQNCIG